MHVTEFSQYKQVIADNIKQNQNLRGYSSLLAKAAGCSRSFLSQVLAPNLDVDLTRDHAIGLCQFWNYDELETNYFLLLVDLARARFPRLTEFLKSQIEKAKRDLKNLSRQVQKEPLSSLAAETHYYSKWETAAIHILLTIPEYRHVKKISERLQMELNEVEKILKNLIELDLVERNSSEYQPKNKDMNLSETSPLSAVNHANWRMKAVTALQKRGSDNLHFSSIFSMSREDLKKLREMIRKFILESRHMIINSPAEELVCLNIDCFKV